MAADGDNPQHFDVKADVTGQYDSNVARQNAQTTGLGLRRDDYTLRPNLTIDIAHPIGRQGLSLIAQIGYDFHAYNTRLDRERILVNGKFDFDISRCNIATTLGYRRQQSDLGEITVLPVNGPESVKNVEQVASIDGILSCGHEYGLRPFVSGGYTNARNSADIRKRSDHDTASYGGGLSYRSPALGTLSAFVNRADTSYPSGSFFSNASSGFTVTSYAARIEREIGARLGGMVEVSYIDLNSRIPGVSGFSGLGWNAKLAYRAMSRMTLTATASRAAVASLSFDSVYHVDKVYGLEADYAFSRRMKLMLSYTHMNRDFVGSSGVLAPLLTHDRRDLAIADLGYEWNRRMRIGLQLGYESRTANNTFFDYDNTRVAINLSRKF